MAQKLPILKIKKHDRIWLEELYKNNYEGNQITIKDIWGKIHDRLPNYYRPESMDSRLINQSCDSIRIMGVTALQRSNTVLKKIDAIIYTIRSFILADTKTKEISLTDIEQKTGFTPKEISFLFRQISDYGIFYTGGKHENNPLIFNSFFLQDDVNIFYNYKEFPGIEKLIILKTPIRNYQKEERFNYEEMMVLNTKIDTIKKDIAELKLGQEIIYEDVMKELEELKSLYNLSKKNWRQVFIGKLSEMVLSGIIDETVSKKIIDFLIPQLKRLLF